AAALLARILADPQLPAPPAVVLQVLERASRPDCRLADISDLISRDPALGGKVLEVVNAALYNLPHTATSIARAVSLMGLPAVRSLVLAVSIPAVVGRGSAPPVLQDFWKTSLAGAIIAHTLALQLCLPCPEDDFVAGLLRDLG